MKFFNKLVVSEFVILVISFLLLGANSSAYSQEKVSGDMNPGRKLPLNYKCVEGSSPTYSKSTILPSGDLLLGICNKIFRLTPANKIVWQHDIGQIGNIIYLPAANRVYVSNDGSTMFTFNASTGKQLDVFAQNGSAVFKKFQSFGRDGFLYVASAEAYRPRISDMADELNYWSVSGGDWTIKIPSNCEIVVQGQKIYAVTTTAEGVFVKELKIPRKK